MKKGINTADVLDLAEVEMRVFDLSVGAFMDKLSYNYDYESLNLTDDELDQIEFALVRKAIADNYGNDEMMDMLIDHAYAINMSADDKDYTTTDCMLGKVKARNIYEAIRDIINS